MSARRVVLAVTCLVPAVVAKNQTQVLMDSETEAFLTRIANRIGGALKHKYQIQVYVLNDWNFNAFAVQDNIILINVGAILRCESVGELIAIVAHEVGHIICGHALVQQAYMDEVTKSGIAMMLTGVCVGIAAGSGEVAVASAAGTLNTMLLASLAKKRQHENVADTKAAQAVCALHWPVFKSFVSAHQKLNMDIMIDNKLFSTHPLSKERIDKYMEYQARYSDTNADAKAINEVNELQEQFELIKQKMQALVYEPADVIARIKTPKNAKERYAAAIANYRARKYKAAMELLNSVMKNQEPGIDPAYCAEILAMCLIKSARYSDAAQLAWQYLEHNDASKYRDLAMIYTDAVIEGNLREHAQQAIGLAKKIAIRDRHEAIVINLLGKLYTLAEMPHEASICAAEAALLAGDKEKAVFHAKKAISSPNEITKRKANDIILACKRPGRCAAK